MIKKLVFGSTNKNKLKEIMEILEGTGIDVVGAGENFNPEETGTTFEENAYIKAYEAAKKEEAVALADDSGLVVDALDGRPGIYSSRYESTNEKRIAKLLKELDNVPQKLRTARFVCAMCVVSPDGKKLFSTTETCEGEIAFTPSGTGGFGYDPVFYLPQKNATMAEINSEEKNKISHRGKALKKTLEWLLSESQE